jgi:poly-gamma-glutamate synthesis protein (capsule biosynthesis protein)
MMGRRVERMAQELGEDFMWRRITDYLASVDAVVGNLEGPVPREHVETPDLTFRFSFPTSTLPVLARHHFRALSLANNHAYDAGIVGYEDTVAGCRLVDIACFGHPLRVGPESGTYLTLPTETIWILGLNLIGGTVDLEAVTTEFEAAGFLSPFRVAYIHWGDEYTPVPNASQRDLAHALIDIGFDAVIGHHPHVIQSVEIYRDRPIFYSLGNLVFDQYFSQPVQEGLLLHLTMTDALVRYRLVPVESWTERSVPGLLESDSAALYMEQLLRPLATSSVVAVHVQAGEITVQRPYSIRYLINSLETLGVSN